MDFSLQVNASQTDSSTGYHHTYDDTTAIDLSALGSYPSDTQIIQASQEAARLARDLLEATKMWPNLVEAGARPPNQFQEDIMVDEGESETVACQVSSYITVVNDTQPIIYQMRMIYSSTTPGHLQLEEQAAVESAICALTALDIDVEDMLDSIRTHYDQARQQQAEAEEGNKVQEELNQHYAEFQPAGLHEKAKVDMLPLGGLAQRSQRGAELLLDQLKAHRNAHQCDHLKAILKGRQSAAISSTASDSNGSNQSPQGSHAAVHSAILRGLLESTNDERWRKLTGMSRNVRWTGGGTAGREMTEHEVETRQNTQDARSHKGIGARAVRYRQLDQQHPHLGASIGSVSAKNPLKIGSLVVFGLHHTQSCDELDLKIRNGEGLALGYVRYIYTKPSPAMPRCSVESTESLGLVSNIVIQELFPTQASSGVFTNRNSRGQARIFFLNGHRVVSCLDTYNSSMQTVEPPAGFGFDGHTWRVLDPQAQARYYQLQSFKGVLAASLAPIRKGLAHAGEERGINADGGSGADKRSGSSQGPSGRLSKRTRR
ncbi:BQ5605_C002g01666 [Microbotryum silenes-dioicae]|uniref:BQ5605_C002g01666 protein n=1 Tax=Microbotryum silenes-dioicae TaxID=796604 RepID=A0A2X0LZC8_9BASI|nr:BQ5605_C002g01666 [Microbotryum silenes-dioicae]